MDYNIHKICRVCLEEGALTSIYSTEFAMMPSNMIMLCAKVRVYKTDGLPAVICNNCIYRLGVAYHFKQECENSDIRLRQYLGLPERFGYCDAETNTDIIAPLLEKTTHVYIEQNDIENSEDDDNVQSGLRKTKRRSRYQRKPLEDHKKRGPKPLPKLPQTCYECNKTFKCAAQLEMHIRTHTGEKPFSCSYCPRKFAQKYNLQIHVRVHTKERPFQCEICSKQFSALGNFQAHQKIHTGIRDQMCPVCQKAFYNAGDLSKHMVTHSNIKNHHCDVCGKRFSRQRDMQAHKRKLHLDVANTAEREIQEQRSEDDEEDVDDTDPVAVGGSDNIIHDDNFKCPDCDKEFTSAGSLSVHFRVHGNSGAHGNNNLLNLPMSGQHLQMTTAHSMQHAHHYHPAAPPPPTAATGTVHSHDGLHATHHLPLNTGLQSNHTAATMSMTHPTMAHMLAPPPMPPPPLPTTPTGQNALAMMHHAGQRLHPY